MRGPGLSKEAILTGLRELSDALAQHGIKGELCLFGGTVMVLAYNARISTKDVDAIFHPTSLIRNLARQIAQSSDLPEDWLNDGVKGFISSNHQITTGTLPQFPNLRLTMPVPEYLLAMKCMASRIDPVDEQAGDVRDIIFLIRHLNLKSAERVLELIAEYYPTSHIPIKSQYLVEGLFDEGKI